MKNVIDLAYLRYKKTASSASEPELRLTHVDDPARNTTRIMTKEEFIQASKTNDEFVRHWVQPVVREMVTFFKDAVSPNEFPNGPSDFIKNYPETLDLILDKFAELLTVSYEDFSQAISLK